ncbi:MAG: purine-nucleoside phosphorylase [Saprospiraceae bacterium]|nr:purine-nucleoside phosphorylase [Saprospiraceae bacterium]
MQENIQQATAFLRDALGDHKARAAIILGSGFSDWISAAFIVQEISYAQIPGFSNTSVDGHPGRLYLLQIGSIQILALQGRFHFYEGHDMHAVALPIRVLRQLGILHLMLTNAAGGINTNYQTGDLMVIADHINFFGLNPLIGPNLEEYGTRFPDTSRLYHQGLRKEAIELAKEMNIVAHTGVYIYTVGPNFETPAEIRMMRLMGADAVGMSTVPEALVAHHMGITVFAISLIANPAAGTTEAILDHQDVLETLQSMQTKIQPFITQMMMQLAAM